VAATATEQVYSRRDVCRWLKIRERQLASWEKQGLVPALSKYTLPDLAAIRTLSGLRKQKISPAALRTAITAIRARAGAPVNPLTEWRLYSEGRRLRIQFGGAKMEAVTGQLLFDFDTGQMRKLLAFPNAAPNPAQSSTPERRREAEAWFEKGLDLERTGASIEEVTEAYLQAAAADPNSAGALVNLGTVYFNARRFREAERYYRMALEVDPNYALAHFNLANLHDERGQRDAALAHYLAALRIQPQYSDAHYNIALLYQATGQTLRAVRHWRAYLKLDGASEWAGIARRELEKLRASTIVPGARSKTRRQEHKPTHGT
jgi:tetratricopeptide (TPR) repeat protein